MTSPAVIEPVATQPRAVFEGIRLAGEMNTPEPVILEQVARSIRRGHPQVWGQPIQADRVALVGGGPSLAATEAELVDLVHHGAKVVTVNNAHRWCLARNIRPSAHIVLDARPRQAHFVEPAIPRCHYLLASQCHDDTWNAVAGREVRIWHAGAPDGELKPLLDAYYLGHWQPIVGGTTVIMRALMLLRCLGYLRFDLFGVDSCYLDGQHHAYPQPENDSDRRLTVNVTPPGHPERARAFTCAPWHIKQLECFLETIRTNGETFAARVHGDGLLAFALRELAGIEDVVVDSGGD